MMMKITQFNVIAELDSAIHYVERNAFYSLFNYNHKPSASGFLIWYGMTPYD